MIHRSRIAVAVALGTTAIGVDVWGQADVGASQAPTATGAQAPQSAAPTARTPAPPPAQTNAPPPMSADAQATWERDRAYAAWQAWQYQYAAWLAAQHREPPRRWYGWQTLVSDSLSVALVIAGAAVESGPRSSRETGGLLVAAGFVSFPIVPPVLHLVHGNGGKAALSAGMRLGSTLLLFLGALQCADSNRQCDNGYGALAVVGALGLPTAVVVDAAIAFEDVEPGEEARLTVAPWISPMNGGGAAGLRGAF